jgi:hypothetical protein
MLNGRGLIAPTVNVGMSVTVIEIPVFGTQADAASVASRILGRPA